MSSWFFLLPVAIAAMAEAETACNISEKNWGNYDIVVKPLPYDHDHDDPWM
jgi:hypothetical protein